MTTAPRLTFEETSRTLKAGELTLHYNEAGEGPVLVMLHGGGPGASSWSNFHQNLARLSQSFRVLLVDQPGFGRSDKPDVSGPFRSFSARAIKDLLDELGIEKAHFVGNSLGGGTTLRFALDFPDRADRLVLMGPGGGALPLFSPEPSEGIKALRSFYDPPGPTHEKMRAFIRLMVYDERFVTDDLVDERFEAAVDPEAVRSGARIIAGLTQHAEEPLWPRLHEISHPTLLIWGRDDRVLPLDGAFFALKRMQDARLHVFPRCGHWAQLEHRGPFDWLTTQFLLEGSS